MLEQKINFIGVLHKNFQNAHKKNQYSRKRLLLELIAFFCSCDDLVPAEATICLKHHYSHKLIKTTLSQLGYTTSKKPNPKKLNIKRK